ncbi:MAG: ribonuclease D, partial [Myxococcota bacterium]
DNPEQTIILHGGDYDVVSMKRDYNVHINSIFDTMLASQFIGLPRIGLADLIDRYFGHYIDKKYQRYDWSKRPLLPEHLHYARGDTHFLLALREVLERKLHAVGRYEAFREECELLAQREWSGRTSDPGDFLRVKKSGTLDDKGKRVLRSLWTYRDARAKRLDRPSFKVISDGILLDLSRSKPTTADALHQVIRPSSSLARKYGDEILEHITAGLADERPLPKKSSNGRSQRSRSREAPGIDWLYGPLKDWRNKIVEQEQLSPTVVISNQQLKDIARVAPDTLQDLADIDGVRSWQVEYYGEQILEIISSSPAAPQRKRRKRTARSAR